MNNKEIRSKLYEMISIFSVKGEAENTTKYEHLYHHLSEALSELEGIMTDNGELETLTDLDVDDDAFISLYDDDNDGNFWGV